MPKPSPQGPTNGFRASRQIERITVSYSYPVHFVRDAFSKDNKLIASLALSTGESGPFRVLFFLDSGVHEAFPDLAGQLEDYARAHPEALALAGPVQAVPGGEAAKMSAEPLMAALDAMARARLCRHSFVVAVGGGSVLDVVGMAASLVHRGLRLIRFPSTVLSQCDAGVGVKNGINAYGAKNFLGSFAPPFAVVNDSRLLTTLPQDHWIGGAAEAFKVAIIKDRAFFNWLARNAELLAGRDLNAMEHLVKKAAKSHLDHIATSGDPFEFGCARPLDFGHWSAHRLEVLSNYEMGHGQAVSVGIALDCVYAEQEGLLSHAELKKVLAALSRAGLPVFSTLLEARTPEGKLAVLKGLTDFREHLGGELTVTLPDGLGKKIEVHAMNEAVIEQSVMHLKKLAAP
ncbi:MAG: 3-dehydroquinate synthase [Deltaproteobacteria bacterium]|nr:3-dehydroquinate synthase [Deltaproteobacteria bacterium]